MRTKKSYKKTKTTPHDNQVTTRPSITKSPLLYLTLILVWVVLTVVFWMFMSRAFGNDGIFTNANITTAQRVCATILITLNGIFISYFWLNGVKDLIYVLWYLCAKKRLARRYYKIINTDVSQVNDRVLLVYCTCNDFDATSLRACLHQKYQHYDVVILDDSNQPTYQTAVDKFAQKYHIKVVRRPDRTGFKAGNINHYLMSDECRNNYDYFVILDSDEIIPDNYITQCLKYFYALSNVGIVQANHISTRNKNFFMKLFHIGVNSHWPTYQTMKHFYGFSTMLGHGAMIKSECYYTVGGFPQLVAEDLCLSIEARNQNYLVAFAPNIICSETYPIDYVAFKKRHSKWTQGNLEFIKKYTGKIIHSKMKWYEKMDIVLFTYNLPLTALFAFYLFLNLIFFPVLHINLAAVYQTWMIIPTVVFFFSPTFNDIFTWFLRINPFRFVLYFFATIILYGSMFTTSLVSAVLGVFGKKAKFIVTPKTAQKMTFGYALKFQFKEIIFSTLLLALAIIFTHSVLPVIIIITTGYLSIGLLFLSNKKYSARQVKLNDKQTQNLTLKLNSTYQYTKTAHRRKKLTR